MVLSIICRKCRNKDEKKFKEEPIQVLKVLDLINNIEKYQKSMVKENIRQEFRLKEIEKTRNYFINYEN